MITALIIALAIQLLTVSIIAWSLKGNNARNSIIKITLKQDNAKGIPKTRIISSKTALKKRHSPYPVDQRFLVTLLASILTSHHLLWKDFCKWTQGMGRYFRLYWQTATICNHGWQYCIRSLLVIIAFLWFWISAYGFLGVLALLRDAIRRDGLNRDGL